MRGTMRRGDVTAGAGLVFESAAPITQGETSLESPPFQGRATSDGQRAGAHVRDDTEDTARSHNRLAAFPGDFFSLLSPLR